MIRSSKISGRRRVRLSRALARSRTLPPPYRGWNARDSLLAMKEDEATILDNWFPERTFVRSRGGSAVHATGLPGFVESLMVWDGPSSAKMFAASGTTIHDVSSVGAVGSAAISSLTNARWQHVNFANSAGNYLYIVNGADAPRYYNGSTWTTPTITGSGLTASDLIHVAVFKNTLLFVEKNSLSFWYFPTEAIAGSITEFNLGPRCDLGGQLQAVGTWTVDGIDGPSNYAAFVTTNGQVVIYQGSDPGDATDWSHLGTLRIGPPIGRRCLMQIGGEIIVLTTDGFVGLSQSATAGRAKGDKAYSDQISGAVESAIKSNKTKFGWQAIFYPDGHKVLVNIPTIEGQTADQYVRNTHTEAWCRFKGWNAGCFEIYNDDLYFGGDNVVDKADTGNSDKNADITLDARGAFSQLGMSGRLKHLSMMAPYLASNGNVTVKVAMNRDFTKEAPVSNVITITVPGGDWDDAIWDEAEWADVGKTKKYWRGAKGECHTAAPWINVVSQAQVEWSGTEVIFTPGGFIG